MNDTSTFGLGAMMLGGRVEPAGRAGNVRQTHDFYPTPPDATLALLRAEGPHIARAGRGRVWEPACGDGAIARVLEGNGIRVVGTDLVYRGYGEKRPRDFLKERQARAMAIVTNPPFDKRIVVDFIDHALNLCPRYVAMFLKATFFHAAGRRALFDRRPPAMIYPLTWRPDFLGLDAPALECSWYVWRPRHPSDARGARYQPLPRPERTGDA